jgi:hypothetical protein
MKNNDFDTTPTIEEQLNTELVPSENQSLEAAKEKLELQFHTRNFLISTSLKNTRSYHWIGFNKKDQDTGQYKKFFQIVKSGAAFLARQVGATVSYVPQPIQELEDNHFVYEYLCRIQVGEEIAEAIGSCSTKHKLLGTNPDRNSGKEKRPIESVDLAHIKSTAQTRALVRAVSTFFSAAEIPEDEFEDLTGYRPPSIKFQENKKRQERTPAEDQYNDDPKFLEFKAKPWDLLIVEFASSALAYKERTGKDPFIKYLNARYNNLALFQGLKEIADNGKSRKNKLIKALIRLNKDLESL